MSKKAFPVYSFFFFSFFFFFNCKNKCKRRYLKRLAAMEEKLFFSLDKKSFLKIASLFRVHLRVWHKMAVQVQFFCAGSLEAVGQLGGKPRSCNLVSLCFICSFCVWLSRCNLTVLILPFESGLTRQNCNLPWTAVLSLVTDSNNSKRVWHFIRPRFLAAIIESSCIHSLVLE